MLTCPAPDPLMLEYYELCDTFYIENRLDFVARWKTLAGKFEAQARPAMAAMCRSRGEMYGRETGTEYVRIADGHTVELLEVA